ncbi:MAG: outer membrane protein assembly factor BamB family protein [Tepidisphaeraceae bacterium]
MPTARFRAPATEPLENRTLFAASAPLYPYTFGGPGFDNVQKAIITPTGDTLITGLFSGTVNFDRAGGKAGVRTAQGDTDIYVAEYTPAGALKWVTQIGGDYTDKYMQKFDKRDLPINQSQLSLFVGKVGEQPRGAGEYVNDIVADAAGNVYLAGDFKRTITAGKFSLTADETFTSDYYDAMVLKLSSTGQVTWVNQTSGPFDDAAMTLGLDGSGTPIVGGYFQRQAAFDTTRGKKIYETNGRDGGYVTRLDPATGKVVWEYQFVSRATGQDERDAVNGIVVTSRGDVYLAGTYAYKANFDENVTNYTLRSEGKTDAFLAKISRKGAFQWALSTGGKQNDGNSAITMDAQGNIYTAGYFSDKVDVNPLPNVETDYEATVEPGHKSATFPDILVSKFAPDGTPVWQDQMGGPYFEIVAGITVDAQGGVDTVGSFFNTADFAPGKAVFNLNSAEVAYGDSIKDLNTSFGRHESYDWFVSRLSPRGKFVNAVRIGGGDDDYASGISVDNNGNLLIAGRATSTKPTDRKDRNEQALIELLSPELNVL